MNISFIKIILFLYLHDNYRKKQQNKHFSMKNKYIICLIVAVLSLYSNNIRSQEVDEEISDYTQLDPEDYLNITLPPLDLLFANARNNPAYQLAQNRVRYEHKLLTKEKKSFLSFFSLRGSYQYGMLGNDITYSDVVTPVVSSYSSTAQNNYTIGGVVNIPISDFFDLSARVTRQRINARSAELEREIKFEELKKEIVQLYATATSQLTILKMKAENVMLASTQYKIVEKDFVNGQANSSELSTEKANQTKALEEYEISKSQLNTSLLMLEIVTHTPLVNIPKIKK